MKNALKIARPFWLAVLLAVSAAASAAERIAVARDRVIPIRFERDVTIKRSRAGDAIWAVVDSDRELPYDTVFHGRIRSVRKASGSRPGYIELDFHTVELPNGQRQKVRAVPIALDSRYVYSEGDGRLVARRRDDDAKKKVLGGLLTGLWLGSLIDKPFEGAVAGAVLGIITAEANRADNDSGLVIRAGRRMGALIERDFQFVYDGPWPSRRSADDWRRRDRRYPADSRDAEYEREDRRPEYERRGEPRHARIEIGRTELRFEDRAAPFRDGDAWMVPLEASANQVGIRVDYTQNGRRIVLEGERTTAILEPSSSECRLNGIRREMPAKVTVRDGTVYVPAQALAWAADESLTIDGTKHERSAFE